MSTKESEQQLDMRTVELLYNFAKESFTNYLDTIDKLDQKIVTLISLDGVIISLIFSFGANYRNFLFYISIFFIFISMLLGILGYMPRKVYIVDPIKTCQDYYKYNYNDAISHISSNLVEVSRRNQNVIERKKWFIIFGFWALLISLVLFTITKCCY
jgi:hypothetical protein